MPFATPAMSPHSGIICSRCSNSPSKFDKVSTVSFAPLDQAAIITDRLPDPEYGERTVVKEVALL